MRVKSSANEKGQWLKLKRKIAVAWQIFYRENFCFDDSNIQISTI